MEAVWLAAIVAVGALLTTVLNGWMLRRSKLEDYARQDAVAAAAEEREGRQEERAHRVAFQAAEAARLLIADNAKRAKVLADADDVVNGKLNQIHELVNSTLTESMEDQLLALQQLLAALTEIISLHRQFGSEPSVDTMAAESATRRRVAELRSKLADRAQQTKLAAAQRVDTPGGDLKHTETPAAS